jgi:uncharacterized membrane protein
MNDGVDEHDVDVQASLWQAVSRVEAASALDGATVLIDRVSKPLGRSGAGPVLRGDWLGHALHPLLTDLALGCWTAAGILDLSAPRSDRRAARRLVGAGLLFALPTAASGVAEYGTIRDDRTRRVAAAHAIGNTGVVALYLMSWRCRCRGHPLRGAVVSTIGGLAAIATGYLGGHLSFVLGAGAGQRGRVTDTLGLPTAAADV